MGSSMSVFSKSGLVKFKASKTHETRKYGLNDAVGLRCAAHKLRILSIEATNAAGTGYGPSKDCLNNFFSSSY
jgi:hypothetical protein